MKIPDIYKLEDVVKVLEEKQQKLEKFLRKRKFDLNDCLDEVENDLLFIKNLKEKIQEITGV